MPDPTSFLLARIADEEELARQPYLHSLSGITATDPTTLIGQQGQLDDWQKHVLAECEAKRRIIGMYERALDAETTDRHLWAAYREERTAFQRTLEALANVYADHPEFDESWRVE